MRSPGCAVASLFLLTPLREGRLTNASNRKYRNHFYSRPCGRGDQLFWRLQIVLHRFLLTPLREGRQDEIAGLRCGFIISTHAPAGGATHKCLKS